MNKCNLSNPEAITTNRTVVDVARNTISVVAGQGAPRAVNDSTINRESTISNREVSSISIKNENSATVVKNLVKLWAVEACNLTKAFLIGHNYTLSYEANDSLENLLSEFGKAVLYVYKLGVDFSWYAKYISSFNDFFIEKTCYFNSGDLKNTMFSFQFIAFLFTNTVSVEKKRTIFTQIKPSENSESVAEINVDIDSMISLLIKCKFNYYFPILIKSMSYNIKIVEKIFLWKDYLGVSGDLDSIDALMRFVNEVILKSFGKNMVVNLVNLQILLDCFELVKNETRSRNNINIALIICRGCIKSFEEDLPSLKSNKVINAPYGKDHLSVLKVLRDIEIRLKEAVDDFEKLLTSSKKDDWGTVTTKAHERRKKKATASNRKAQNQRSANTSPTATNTNSPEPKMPENAPKANAIITTTPTVNLVQPVATAQNVDLDAIAQETNELMRAFRQELEKYRIQSKQEEEERLRIKQERDALVQLSALAQQNPALAPVQAAPVPDLKDAHISTWKALIVDKHLTVEHADLNVLLTRLNGRSVGNGGSQFEIEFFDFNKNIYVRCGQYEDNHGQDRSDRLKKGQGKNVCQAIDSGISRGLININQETKDKVFGKIN